MPKIEHCDRCDVCIINMDHHCPFSGQCIGRYNICCFLTFICTGYIALMISAYVCYKVLND